MTQAPGFGAAPGFAPGFVHTYLPGGSAVPG
jgi:hypothetical protein